MITLNNGNKMPSIGLGTWNSDCKLVKQAVTTALNSGYRHIDCAKAYENESEIGEAINESNVPRSEIFITSKLWNTNHRPEHVETGLKSSLKNLKIEYLDMFLMHWPIAFDYQGEEETEPLDYDTFQVKMDNEADYLDTWKELEQLYKTGVVKNIGVCNFNLEQMKRLIGNCEILPHVLQIEVHPFWQQDEIVDFCRTNEIAVTGYSPLGSPGYVQPHLDRTQLLYSETITNIAEKHSTTAAQVMLKWGLQRGICVIPKSVTTERIVANISPDVIEFEEDDLRRIKELDRSYFGKEKIEFKVVEPNWWNHSTFYPF